MWIGLGFLLLLLFVFFRTFVLREIAWAYPADYDQTKYLGLSYGTYETVLERGLAAGLRQWGTTAYENGMLIHLPALALMLAFGGGRLTVLAVNYAALALYLVVVAAVVRSWTGSARMALLGVGLALGTGSFWFQNQVDYRLDFSSLCLFGIFVSLVMRSAVFRERRWAVAAGLAAAALVANRFLTSLYVAGIYAGMLVYFAAVCPWLLKRREPAALKNAALSAAVGAALSLPAVLVSARAIYGYYVVQQGIEKSVRDAEFSVAGVLEFWLYYPKSLLAHHVGLPLAIASVLAVTLGVVAARSRARPRISWPSWCTDAAVFLAIGFLVILGALTANITRSPVVGGTAVPLFTWSVVLASMALFGTGTAADGRVHRAATVAAALTLVLTVGAQLVFYSSHHRFWKARDDMREIGRMYADIGRYAEDVDWPSPVVASDSQRDYLIAGAITAAHYESTGRLVPFRASLAGGNVMAPPRDVLLAQMRDADFLILTHRRDPMEPPYPIVAALEEVRPELNAAASRMLPVGEYPILGRLVSLYARRAARVLSGVSGNWITADGIVAEVPVRAAQESSDLVISAGMNPWVDPAITASCESSEGGALRRLPADFTIEGQSYTARCTLPQDADGDGRVRVRLFFSHYFVPRDKGLNDDPRRLSMLAPPRIVVVSRETAAAPR
jgi:hypothetical protein